MFDPRPTPNSELIFGLALLFGLAIIGSGVAWFLFMRRERTEPVLALMRRRIVYFLFVTGFVGLILVFFRWQGIPYFAIRFWLVTWILAVGYWLGQLLGYILKKFPKERTMHYKREERERYLPKPKKTNG